MFTLNFEIKQVNQINTDSSPAIIWVKDELIYENGTMLIQEKMVNFHRKQNIVLIEKDFEGSKEIINLKNIDSKISFKTGIDGFHLIINEEKGIRTFFSDDYSKSFISCYNWFREIDEWIKEFSFHACLQHEEILFICSLSELFVIDLQTKIENWKININDIIETGSITKIIGTYKEELIVLLKGGVFIGLDLQTGKLNWKHNTVEENQTGQKLDFGFGDPPPNYVFQDGQFIYIFGSTVLIVFDLEQRKASYRYASDDEYGFGGFNFQHKCLQEGQFYFSAALRENAFNADTIGIFDLASNKIVWLHTFDFPKGVFIINLQVNENRIFVLDSTYTLQIMEKI